jgi:hypothetical protein
MRRVPRPLIRKIVMLRKKEAAREAEKRASGTLNKSKS